MRTLNTFPMLKVVCVLMICGGCSAVQRTKTVAAATAVVYNLNGTPIGTAQLAQDASGRVNVDIYFDAIVIMNTPASLPVSAGTHRIHFHQVGKCEGGATAFSTAGGHFNPLSKQHGLENPSGAHAGDAPNIVIPPGGVAKVSFSTDRVSLTAGPTSLFDADGSSIVIHAGADDQMSQPSGNSGGRIACGVIKALP
jgi:Cu-Zn family superoxide dismutase